jgi:hypothetical protein
MSAAHRDLLLEHSKRLLDGDGQQNSRSECGAPGNGCLLGTFAVLPGEECCTKGSDNSYSSHRTIRMLYESS